jgi:two-component system, OmpR family, response regulator
MRILIIEDDDRISNFLMKGLVEQGYSPHLAKSGEQARDLVLSHEWDVILMDIMLHGLDGIQLTRLIRFKHNYTPILVMSALSGVDDKINALDSGADDYITKPFHFRELLSRINALTRRTKLNYQEKANLVKCGELTINNDEHKVFDGNRELELTPKEFRLLGFLAVNKNKVLTRSQILMAVWNINYDNNTNVIDVYISYLREKIDKNRNPKMIRTIKGRGYMISDKE